MRAACSVIRPSAGGSASTPLCRGSFALGRPSMRPGTLASRSGFSLRSAAHMIGSAAFFAPEMRTSPSSGRPPVILSLSIRLPLLGRERAHGQGVDFLAHALAQRGIYQLMALDAALAGERAGD